MSSAQEPLNDPLLHGTVIQVRAIVGLYDHNTAEDTVHTLHDLIEKWGDRDVQEVRLFAQITVSGGWRGFCRYSDKSSVQYDGHRLVIVAQSVDSLVAGYNDFLANRVPASRA